VAEIQLSETEAVVRASVGLVEVQRGESLDAALRRADAALYDAKRTGRNRLVVA
jgi:diguanylate cyclase